MELPKELIEKVYKVISTAKADGKIRRGANEATKSLERAEAKLIAYASDVSPMEITMHFEPLGKEKGVPVVAVPAKSELGAAAGLPVGTAAISVVHPGDRKFFEEVLKSLKALSEPKKSAEKNETKKEEKSAEKPKGEKKAKEPKEEKPVEEKAKSAEPKEEKQEGEPAEEATKVEEKAEPEKEPEEGKVSIDEKAKPEEEPESGSKK